MTGAVALAIVLVVAVVGISMAMESQRSANPARPTRRAPRPTRQATPSPRRARDRIRERKTPEAEVVAPMASPENIDAELKGPDLLHSGELAEAKVISVVDERTIGPVTKSRLALKIDPAEGDPFEVTIRHTFPTPDSRAKVRVGGTVPVRYDKDDRTRVVVDLPQGS